MLTERTRDMIALNMIKKLGPRKILALLGAIKDPKEVFSMDARRLAGLTGGCSGWEVDLRSIKSSRVYEEELAYIEKNGINVVSYGDEDYPENLRNIYDPPAVLYFRGTMARKDKTAIAIVGSRKCSKYGAEMAESIAYDLAASGITVVSGMAKGIDEAAHRGAVKAGGRTAAVLGSGFRHIYPPDSEELVSLILENGLVMTEFSSETMPLSMHFPRRNRIISGLSLGVLVVEAAEKSGSLITADLALGQGREVYAVPGRVDISTASGTNHLIQEGAKLVTSAKDILAELGMAALRGGNEVPRAKDHVVLSDEQKKVIDILDSDKPCHFDHIAERAGMTLPCLSEILLKMELKKLVRGLPGKNYVRT